MSDATTGTAHASARVDTASPMLLAYDAAAQTLEVRETGAPVFALRLHVTDVLPFRLR